MLEDKVIYITGGSSGIGLSIAEHCLKNNAQVVITGRNEDRLEKDKKKGGGFSFGKRSKARRCNDFLQTVCNNGKSWIANIKCVGNVKRSN